MCVNYNNINDTNSLQARQAPGEGSHRAPEHSDTYIYIYIYIYI